MCQNAERWVYRLEHHVTWDSGYRFPSDMAFEDKYGVRWLEIRATGEITVLSGYSWDGCTPKVCVLDLLFGIPDGVVDSRTGRPRTYYASLIHDVCYQFLGEGLPLTRSQADHFFLRLMTSTGFVFRGVYFLAVRIFAGLFRRAAKRVRGTKGEQVPLTASLAQGTHILIS